VSNLFYEYDNNCPVLNYNTETGIPGTARQRQSVAKPKVFQLKPQR